MRFSLILLSGLAFLVFLVSGILMLIPPQLTEDTVQARLDAKLPFESKTDKLLIFTIPKGLTVHFGPNRLVVIDGIYTARSRFSRSIGVEGRFTAQGVLALTENAVVIRDLNVEDLTAQVATPKRTRKLGAFVNDLLHLDDDNLVEKLKDRKLVPAFLKVAFADIRILRIDGSKWWHPLAPWVIWFGLPFPGLLLHMVMVGSAILCAVSFALLGLRPRT